MKLHALLKVKTRGKKRVGRGIGSGLGKTAGRGTKGQKARGSIPVGFSGAGLSTFKKLPKRSGEGNRRALGKLKLIKLDQLNVFKPNSVVDLEQLFELKIINKTDIKKGVKVLADGKLGVALTVKLQVSETALKEIESKGGKTENV